MTAGLFKIETLDDFNKDLVSWTGSWIRAPEDLLEDLRSAAATLRVYVRL